MASEMTLQEHAEAWWREQGKSVPERGTPEHGGMYRKWCDYAFSGPDFQESVIVRVKSRRARKRMVEALGYLPQGYYLWTSADDFRGVSHSEWVRLKGIKGLTRARVDRTRLRRYLYE